MKYLFLLLPLFSLAQKKDTLYWNHIRNDDNLKLIYRNVTRSGTVLHTYKEKDGDIHVWIITRTKIQIVLEIICSKAVPVCEGYTNRIPIPKPGDKIKVVGDYVFDNRHKWYEIHPVKKLTKLSK